DAAEHLQLRAHRAPDRRRRARARSDDLAPTGLRRPVAVAEAARRLDQLRLRRIALDLQAQVADVELDLVAAAGERVAPDELQQLVAGEELVRMLGQRREQAELERRQRHELTPHPDLAGGEVDR